MKAQDGVGKRAAILLGQIQRGHQGASAELEKMGKRFPKHPVVLNALGCLALEKGNGEQALAYLAKAKKRGYPNAREQQRNQLIAHAMIGDTSSFDALWSEITAQESQPEREIALLRSALKAARAKQHISIIERCLYLWQERDADSPALALSHVSLLLQERRLDEAVEQLKAMPPIPAENTAELLQAAELANRLKHPAALHYFNKARENTITEANPLQRLIALGLSLKQFKAAAELMETLLAHHSELAESKLYDRLNIHQQANHWDAVEALVPQYLEAVHKGRIKPTGLFRHLSLPGLTDADHLKLANAYLAGKSPVTESPPESVFQRAPRAGRKLRIGFLSADFKQHPVAQLVVEVFERIDRERFEVIGYDLAEDQPSLLRSRVLDALDNAVPARYLTDDELITRIRDDQIDVLIDLQGDTTDTRVWLLRHRLAPVQAGWLGFPGGLGEGVNDYLLADRHVIPETSFADFAEQPVWLPTTYIPNDPERQPLTPPPRVTQDLPEDAVVFCCFNGQYKITREIFHAWCRILQQVDNSILWLRKEDPHVIEHYQEVAAEYGIASDRLIFAPRTQTQIDHLTRLQCADIALDTRPYNAHTTTVDALWARLPVITVPGDSFTSRVAASILHIAGLDAWIAQDIDDYVDKAVTLAKSPNKRAELRDYLTQAREQSPLYSTQAFVDGLQAAFETMYARFEQGLAPAPITDLSAAEKSPEPSNAQQSSTSVALLLEQAETHLYKEQIKQAHELYQQVLAQVPDQPQACHGTGLIHSLCGQYETALMWLDKAVAAEPDNQRWQQHRDKVQAKRQKNHAVTLKEQLGQAQQAHQNGDFVSAGYYYDQVLAVSPRHPVALHYRGLLEVQQGNAEGLDRMREALRIQPNNANFLRNYQKAEALLKRNDEHYTF
ncbi:hypothetical protein GLV89_13575 [Halomonas alkaliantarctica]|nr:hypothetical protein [Halomonas alkaliantarctica]